MSPDQLTMAPSTDHVTHRQLVNIRVPPFIISDSGPDIRITRCFPELCEGDPQTQTTCCHLSPDIRRTSRPEQTVSSHNDNSPGQIEKLRQEVVSSSPSCDLHNSSLVISEDLLEMLLSGESIDSLHTNSLSGSEDPLDAILPSNFELQSEDEFLSMSPSNEDLGVVTVPRFGQCLSYSDLWSDVDTFVNVVDSMDGVTLTGGQHMSAYHHGLGETTIFGLEVIWEAEEPEPEETN